MAARRDILHVDMDAFYASVEQRDRPELRGKPVLVGSDRRRGVVSAASYEARRYGCHSAQPMAVALRLCPQAVVARPRFPSYVEASRQVFGIFRDVTPLVEPLSIDEAFLDVTGTERLFGRPEVVAQRVRVRIREDVGLTASVGVAPNKYLAKIASDLEKPDGLTVITADDAEAILAPLPIERVWGIGPATADRLHQHGIRTIRDMQRLTAEELERHLGSAGRHYYRLARGLDDRPVHGPGEVKSVSHEHTFEEDLEEPAEVRAVLLSQTEDVGRRLRHGRQLARTVTVKIRYGDFETITRSTTLKTPTDITTELWEAASTLFDRWATAGFRPVRLIGMGASQLGHEGAQLTLFPDASRERSRELDRAVDRIQEKYGRDAIRRSRE